MSALEKPLRQQSCQYEYPSPVKIDFNSSAYFMIPSSIILNKNMGDKRITAFSFFSTKRGLGCDLDFSLNRLVEWTGRKPDRHSNGINNKFADVIKCLIDNDYIEVSGEIKNTSYTEAFFKLENVVQECKHDRFAVVYLDELKKILNYRNPNPKDSFLNNDVLLLLFVYLRMMIFRRRNKLLPEEINLENKCDHEYDIRVRRMRSPDTYNDYYCEIAEKLGMSQRTVSKATEILKELKLIYSEQLPRTKHDEKWTTNHTIFCNYYKREGGYLLASGEEYYMSEINRKKKKLSIVNK